MFLLFTNNFCIAIAITSFQYWSGMPYRGDTRLDTIPSVQTFIFQILFCMLVEDLAFHLSHRALHTKWLYQNAHKMHHHHTLSVYYAATAAHPIEYLFGNALTTLLPTIILSRHIHITTTVAWVFFRSDKSFEEHSGYEFSWSPYRGLPYFVEYGYHYYHHTHNCGNYSSFFHLWDSVFNCNDTYWEHLEEFREEHGGVKKHVKAA